MAEKKKTKKSSDGKQKKMPKTGKKYLALSMCDFCSFEIANCGASPIFSSSLSGKFGNINPNKAVVACDKYKSPVEVLRKQFH